MEYKTFVNKFKPKLTTDDCYTPPLVYDALFSWARKHLDIEGRRVVRPFYPGGDYEHFDYPDGCVVIDNPPFSIFTRIVRFYTERGILFLLFAPSLTSLRKECTFIGVGVKVTYENGAVVNTSFVTNMMGDLICTSAPELHRMIMEANDANLRQTKKTLPKLAYPDCVLRVSTLHTMSNTGVLFQVHRSEGAVTSNATTRGKDFGDSVLLSDSKTAEKMKAEKASAEKGKEIAEKETLELTETSRQIIGELNKKINLQHPLQG